MPLTWKGNAKLSSLTLSRPGGEDDGETLATMKIEIETNDAAIVGAALGAEAGDPLEWAWQANDDGSQVERRYLWLGEIATAARWDGKHIATIAGYEVRPRRVSAESVAPKANRIWRVALKVQAEHPPAGAVECWAQFLGGHIPIDLQQDPDLFEAGGRT